MVFRTYYIFTALTENSNFNITFRYHWIVDKFLCIFFGDISSSSTEKMKMFGQINLNL